MGYMVAIFAQAKEMGSEVRACVDRLRKLNVSGLLPEEKQRFFKVTAAYEAILGRTQKYISSQKPVYEKILARINAQNSAMSDVLYKKVDFMTIDDLLNQSIALHEQVENLWQLVGSTKWEKVKSAVLAGCLAATFMLSSLAFGAVAIMGGFAAPMLTLPGSIAFAAFSIGLAFGTDAIEVSAQYVIAKRLHKELGEFKAHIADLRDGIDALNQNMGRFKLDIEVGDSVLKQKIESILSNIRALEAIIKRRSK